jgi:hypothetical protein
MNLYIRLENGQPVEHPLIEDNLIHLGIDPDNLPENYARFERIPQPSLGVYEVYVEATYEWDSDVVKDVHHVRAMTPQEKTEKQNRIKDYWARFGFASWTFNEETCLFDPPVPDPTTDTDLYQWDEATLSWVKIPINT